MTDSSETALKAQLLDDIAFMARETKAWTGREAFSPAVMDAIAAVPRADFVPASDQHRAWRNHPLPIGHGQTISQPFIVALMSDYLALAPDHRVLEIGTGCGYQTAVLAQLAGHVYSVEVIAALADAAHQRLQHMGYNNVTIRSGDGRDGWAEHAPFDAIMVTAAAARIPPALIAQLKPGGRMVIPVGPHGGPQILVVGGKHADGQFETANTLPVTFVPLVHQDTRQRLY